MQLLFQGAASGPRGVYRLLSTWQGPAVPKKQYQRSTSRDLAAGRVGDRFVAFQRKGRDMSGKKDKASGGFAIILGVS